MQVSQAKQLILKAIVEDLQKTNGVVAVVLGGSYATGVAKESSDLDIGIYYHGENPFSIDDIRTIARKYSVSEDLTVTGFYEWGPWVNGGAWIETASGKVDFLYRNLEQVAGTISKAKNGQWENHFEQQPPYGFSSLIYLGETEICIPLYDPNDVVKNLKSEVRPYPQKLKEIVIQQSLWSAEFAIWHADYFRTEDLYFITGCLTRAVKSIVTALFAINEIYPLGDKRSISILEKAQKRPAKLGERVDKILAIHRNSIGSNLDDLNTLFKETAEFAGGSYKPFPYQLKKE